MKKLACVALLGLVLLPSLAFAADLTWPDLVRRPEFWPSQCTLKRALEFESGKKVKAGQVVDVVSINPTEIEVEIPAQDLSFAPRPEETDALARANAVWKSLSPVQRELTFETLLKRQELWPYRVTLTAEFTVDGVRFERGRRVILAGTQGRKLTVVSEAPLKVFDVLPQATDLIDQARRCVAAGHATPARVLDELDGRLVSATTGAPAPLDPGASPRYIAFLRGSNTCPITRRMAPKLVAFYKTVKAAHPEFEMIYVPASNTVPDRHKFAKEMGFPWRATTTDAGMLPVCGQPFASKIPELVVMDPAGNVLINAVQENVPGALKQLQAMLDAPPAKQKPQGN